MEKQLVLLNKWLCDIRNEIDDVFWSIPVIALILVLVCIMLVAVGIKDRLDQANLNSERIAIALEHQAAVTPGTPENEGVCR